MCLKRAVAQLHELGYECEIGPECEFFLFHTDDSGRPTTETDETAGYFEMGPNDLGENARRDMVLTLEDMGFERSKLPITKPRRDSMRLILSMFRPCRQQMMW